MINIYCISLKRISHVPSFAFHALYLIYYSITQDVSAVLVSQPPRDVRVDPTVSVDPPVVGLTAVDVSIYKIHTSIHIFIEYNDLIHSCYSSVSFIIHCTIFQYVAVPVVATAVVHLDVSLDVSRPAARITASVLMVGFFISPITRLLILDFSNKLYVKAPNIQACSKCRL